MAAQGSPTPIFVVGCPRSGTSLVGEIIAHHTWVLNAEEATLVFALHRWQALLAPPVAPLTEAFLRDVGALIRTTMLDSALRAGRSFVVDHTPWHAQCLEAVFKVFPEAYVVHVVRNPWDVAASLERSFAAGYSWAGGTLSDRVDLWVRSVDAVEQCEPNPRVLGVRYEDLCERPEPVTRGLFERLALPWQPQVLTGYTTLHAGSTSDRQPIGRLTGTEIQLVARATVPSSVDTEVTALLGARGQWLAREHGYGKWVDMTP